MGFWAGLGAGAAGRLIGNISDIYGTGAHLRRVKEREALEHERQSFLGRIDAARAAGFHPLLAMGGSFGGGGQGWMSGGSGISIPSGGSDLDPDTKRMRRAQADMAEMQRDAALKALTSQPGYPVGGVQSPAERGQFVVQPASITSVAPNIPYQTAGPAEPLETQFGARNPITGEVMLGNLPSQKASEPLEGMGEGWKTVLGYPMAGRFIWDTWVPDEAKQRIFDMIERAIRNVGRASRGEMSDREIERAMGYEVPPRRRR